MKIHTHALIHCFIFFIMLSLTKIFMPLFPREAEKVFFKGYISPIKQNTLIIYLVRFSIYENITEEAMSEQNVIYGYYSNSSLRLKVKNDSNNLLIVGNNLLLQKLIINGRRFSKSDQVILLLYDYERFKNSEVNTCNEKFFLKLKYYIQRDCNQNKRLLDYQPLLDSPDWIASSMLGKHIVNYINLIGWLINTLKCKEMVSIRQYNLILAMLVDIILGWLILELVFDQKELGDLLFGVLEKLVNLMYSLLKWLMGAPAGLKLNNAFNKMLGKYFIYHVELWWLFLDVSGGKLDVILHIFKYLGYFGLTFQAAIISDMICLATFHSYCIYVYAARLFNIQISGLIALLRLFVGRKYNPLRGGIDSCEYTNQELFVGTVAITILLLLLPTTIMYYIVFTVFRVLSLLVQYVLAKLINIIQTLPCYVVMLWMSQSSKIAGNIFIEELSNPDSPQLILSVKLLNKSIQELISNFKPPVDIIKKMEWKNVATNVFTGKQII